jgi:carbohydrate-binding DOMON domain-containing protein
VRELGGESWGGEGAWSLPSGRVLIWSLESCSLHQDSNSACIYIVVPEVILISEDCPWSIHLNN